MKTRRTSPFDRAAYGFALLSTGALLLGALPARAQTLSLTATLIPDVDPVYAGGTQIWTAALTNMGASDLFITGLLDGADAPLILDDAGFQSGVAGGLTVPAKQTVDATFTISVPANAAGLPAPGQQTLFQGFLTIMGGATSSSSGALNYSSFIVDVASRASVPEPNGMCALASLAASGVLLVRRRNSRNRR